MVLAAVVSQEVERLQRQRAHFRRGALVDGDDGRRAASRFPSRLVVVNRCEHRRVRRRVARREGVEEGLEGPRICALVAHGGDDCDVGAFVEVRGDLEA